MLDKKRDLVLEEDVPKEPLPPEKKWPPKEPFHFTDPRLGTLTGNEEPLKHLRIFPQKESEVEATFYLNYHDKDGGILVRELSTNDSSSLRLPKTNGKPVCSNLVGVIHGFTSTIKTENFEDLIAALLDYEGPGSDKQRMCVIGIDWKRGAGARIFNDLATNAYAQAAANTITVGRITGLLMYLLTIKNQTTDKQIHLIGHSLGSQVAHFASLWFQELMRQKSAYKNSSVPKFRRISGLDPAARHFRGYPGAHLQRDDAAFVDVIHTSSVHRFKINRHYEEKQIAFPTLLELITDPLPLDLIAMAYGDPNELGAVDFYPNGGSAPQPGCIPLPGVTCSHSAAVSYFIDSLNSSIPAETRRATACARSALLDIVTPSCGMPNPMAAPSDSFSYMGYDSERYAGRGGMFLTYMSPRVLKNTIDTGGI